MEKLAMRKHTSDHDNSLKGRVLARVYADDLKRVGGADAKQVSTNGTRDTEIVTDPTWALADHEV
jgi:hypothetical protein